MNKLLAVILVCVLLVSSVALCSCKSDDVASGEVGFTFVVVFEDGSEKSYEIATDKSTVGAALLDKGLIDGEEGAYGLYVKTVDGVYADYTESGAYWSFYIGDEMAMTGVDQTAAEDGLTYKFVYTKAE